MACDCGRYTKVCIKERRIGRRCTRKDTTPVLFAKGELYCFAVIFGLRPSDIRFASLEGEWNITKSNGLNITFAKRKYHADERQYITKNYQEVRTYSPLKAVVQYKRADTEINPYRLFYCP